jgi:integral membrane protein (TIGR03766 family)
MFFMVLFFNKPGVFVFSIPLQTFCFVLGATLFISTAFLLQKRIEKSRLCAIVVKREKWVVTICLLVLFVLQLLFVGRFYIPAGTDAHDIYMSAQGLPIVSSAGVLSNTYFSTFPNNLFLLFFERAVYQINLFFGFGFDFYWVLVVINIIAIDGSLCLIYAIVRRSFSQKIAWFALILGVLLLGFSPWLTVVYSDTLSMPLTLLTFYLYLRLRATRNITHKLLYGLLLGIILCCGFLIKPTTIFSGLAIIVIEGLLCDYKQLLRNTRKLTVIFSVSLAVLLGTFSVRLPYNYVVEHQQLVPYDASKNMPFTYWMMIGLNETVANGHTMYGFAPKDFSTTFAIDGKDAKMDHTVRVIKMRFKDFGPFGYLHYLWKKSIWILSDGTFYWGNEGVREPVRASGGISRIVQQFIYPSGKYHLYYAYMLQTVWLLILFIIASGIFAVKRYAKKEFFIVVCTVFGSIMFVLLFEGRSRYLMNNLGYFIILAALGLDTILNRLKKIRAKHARS